ncbi:ABC transporter permease [Pseudoflavitalea rhizosphaerae]|uniref:ABC transporter permease n=1 Tax=Pseudoflavitalea rhizosphaerae TaxID=1884793 RepID=UPI000F8F3C8F|nr:ABC transporter permease [Pseudoflavitalea rhizosphaerae]
MFQKLIKDWAKSKNKIERIWLLAKIEFKLRYYENRLGLLWALFKPMMDMAVYYIAFKTILKTDVPNFASYLFIGLIIWNFFMECTTGTIQLLYTKKYLYEYSNMNKFEIYLSTLMANSIGFLFNFVMFLLFYNLIELQTLAFSLSNLWMLFLFINLFILSLGVSLILSNIYIVAKDISQIWVAFTTFLFFLSPIFYKLTTFKTSLPALEFANPIAGIIINARRVMMEGQTPDFKLLLVDFGYALLLLLIGLSLLNKLGVKAAEKL